VNGALDTPFAEIPSRTNVGAPQREALVRTTYAFFPRWFAAHPGAVVSLWALLAGANLSAALAMTTWPQRQMDLDTIRRWGTEWLVEGLNVYAVDWGWPDYPPHAMIILSPLSLLPTDAIVPLWAGFNLLLALMVPYLAIRVVRPSVTVREALLPMLMLLCWGGFRTLLQFSLLALAFGLFAMVLAATRQGFSSGAALGLALIKPQITFPVLLWALFARRFRMFGVSLAVLAAGLIVFCLRAGANPVEVAARYVHILRFLYTGQSPMHGAAQLRPLFAVFISDFALVDRAALAAALALLAVICAVGYAEARARRVTWYGAPALAAIWCLLTFHNLTNGFLMLLPMAAALIYAEEAETLALRRTVFWMLQLGLMIDIPNLLQRFGAFTTLSGGSIQILKHADRVLVLVLFGLTLILALKSLRLKTDS
jgi:hypothetical protein